MPLKRYRQAWHHAHAQYKHVWFEANTQPVEFICSAKLILWGFFFMLVGHRWIDVAPAILTIINRWGGYEVWSGVTTCAGIFQLWATLYKWPLRRASAAFLSCAVWAGSAAAIYLTVPTTFYWVICAYEAAVSLWVLRHRSAVV